GRTGAGDRADGRAFGRASERSQLEDASALDQLEPGEPRIPNDALDLSASLGRRVPRVDGHHGSLVLDALTLRLAQTCGYHLSLTAGQIERVRRPPADRD